MRFSPEQTQLTKTVVVREFEPDALGWLFGSKLDNGARGGDIDLFILGDWSTEEAVASRLRFCAELRRRLGGQKIDVVVENKEPSSIHDWPTRHGEPV